MLPEKVAQDGPEIDGDFGNDKNSRQDGKDFFKCVHFNLVIG